MVTQDTTDQNKNKQLKSKFKQNHKSLHVSDIGIHGIQNMLGNKILTMLQVT